MPATIAIDARMIRASGIGVYLQRILPPVLAAMPSHRFVLAGDPRALRSLDGPNVELFDYQHPYYGFKHHLQLPRLLDKRVQLLWTPHFNAPTGWNGKQVATIHDTIYLSRPEFFPGRIRRMVAKWWYGSTIKRSERVIAISDFTAGELARHFPASAQKTTVIKHFVKDGYADLEPSQVLFQGPYILVVGNIKPHKNLGALIRAFDLVKGDLDVDLVVVGQAEGFITADPAAVALLEQGSERIHFPGFVEEGMLKSLYRGAVCTVFPSHYEGFGLGPLESMALGCPVVVSNIPAHREVCGETAATFDPNDAETLARALRNVVVDAAKREQMRADGLNRAGMFTQERAVAQTVELLDSLVN